MKRTPLKRKTALRAKSAPKSRKTRIAPVGRAAKVREPAWLRTVAEVRARARGRCESCGGPCVTADPHHVWKRRRAGVPRSWADRSECIAAICHKCHLECEVKPTGERQRQLEFDALERLCKTFGWSTEAYDALWKPLDIVRDLIRTYKEEDESLAA